MRFLSPRNPMRRFVAALLLTIGVSAFPGRAESACGDHVTPLADHGTHAEHRGKRPTMPGQPCSGPTCSSAPRSAEAPLPVPPPGKDWFAGSPACDETPTSPDRITPNPDERGRVHLPSNTFRPPRFS